jgi:hypothetical protein
LFTLVALALFGLTGLVIPVVVLCYVRELALDPEVVEWFNDIKSKYRDELSSDSDNLPTTGEVVASRKTAVKFALMAQSKVGMLSPSTANREVYERVLLQLFNEHNVRYNIRVSLMGEALVSCFIQPKEYVRAREVVEALGSGEPLPVH